MRSLKQVLSVLALLVCLPALAQSYTPKNVTFSGAPAFKNDEILAASGLKNGAPVDQAAMQAAAQKLSDTGLFSNVQFSFDGATLHYELTPAGNLLPATYLNFPWWDDATLNRLLAARVPLFHGSLPPESRLQSSVVDALTALLAEQKIGASVSAELATDLSTGKPTGVEFRIASPAITIGEVTFHGDTSITADELSPVAIAATGQPWESATIEATLSTAVTNVCRNHGYLRAKTTGFIHDSPIVSADAIRVPVSLTIEPGPQYRLHSITIAGDVLAPPANFDQRALIHAGDIVSEEKLRQTILSVGAPYRAHGYLEAKIKADPTFDETQHTVDYLVHVVPGSQYTMGSLDMTNLDEERKALILKYWKLNRGDIYDATYPATFLKKNSAALRSLDGWGATYKQIAHEDTHIVDLVVTFDRMHGGQ